MPHQKERMPNMRPQVLVIIILLLLLPHAAEAARCQATTQKGAQCKRTAAGGSSFCWQHGGVRRLLDDLAGESPAETPPPEKETKRPREKITPDSPPEGDHIEYLQQYFLNGGHKKLFGFDCSEKRLPEILRFAGFGGKPATSLDLFRHCQDVLRARRGGANPKPTPTPDIPPPRGGAVTARVSAVVDGDTITLEAGQRVRYIGINTPEASRADRITQVLGQRAKIYNERLVLGKDIKLYFDVQPQDKYGRLLGYIYVGDTFVNAELVRAGYAAVSTVPPNVQYAELFKNLEAEARSEGRGLWFVEKQE